MEKWLSVPGYANYEVSDMGRIKNVRRKRLIAPIDARGYRRVGLYLKGVQRLITIHKIVCMAFIGPRPKGHEINHKNGIRDDNRLVNLEYCTRPANALHARRTLHRGSGENHYRCRLNYDAIESIRSLVASGRTQTSVAAEFGVTQAHISQIVLGKSRISG